MYTGAYAEVGGKGTRPDDGIPAGLVCVADGDSGARDGDALWISPCSPIPPS
jgi:hypothetical protein